MKYFLHSMAAAILLSVPYVAAQTDPPLMDRAALCMVALDVTSTPVSCSGLDDGTITVTINDSPLSADPYVITIDNAVDNSWAPAAGYVTHTYTGFASGTHTVKVTRGTSCTSGVRRITVGDAEYQITANVKNICPGASFGSVSLNLTGMQGLGITYQWFEDGSPITAPNQNEMRSGKYKVKVTITATGCVVESDEFEISKLKEITADTVTYDVPCYDFESGSIVFKNLRGGTPIGTDAGYGPFLISVWDENGNPPTPEFNGPDDIGIVWPNDSVYGLRAGAYYAEIREQTTPECLLGIQEFTIDTLKTMDSALFVFAAQPPSSCGFAAGEGDGLITIATNDEFDATKGSFTYWYKGEYSGMADGTTKPFADDDTQAPCDGQKPDGNDHSATICPLPVGEYLVVVQEVNGCATDTLTVRIDNNVVNHRDSVAPPTRCDFPEGEGNGIIFLTVDDPRKGSYAYWHDAMPEDESIPFWADNKTAACNDPRVTADDDSLKATICNMAAGEHQIIIMSTTACLRDTFTIVVPTHEPMKITATVAPGDEPTCIGRSDGKAEVTVEGGVKPFTLEVNDDGLPWYAKKPVVTEIDDVTFAVDSISGGTYSFVVTDDGACSDTAELTFEADTVYVIHHLLDSIPPTCEPDPLTLQGAIIYDISKIEYLTPPHDSIPVLGADTTKFLVYLDGQLAAPFIMKDSLKNVGEGLHEIAFALRYASPVDSGCLELDTIELIAPEPPEITSIDDETAMPECIGLKTGAYGFTVKAPDSRPDAGYDYLLSRQAPDPTNTDDGLCNWLKPYNETNDTIAGSVILGDDTISYGYGKYSAHFTALDTGVYFLWVRDTASKCIFNSAFEIAAEQRLTLDIDSSYRLLDAMLCEAEIDLKLTPASKNESASLPFTLWQVIDATPDPDTLSVDPIDQVLTYTNPDKKDTLLAVFLLRDADGCRLDTVLTMRMPSPVKVKLTSADTMLICNQDTSGFINLDGRYDDYLYDWRRTDEGRYRERVLSTLDSIHSLMAGTYSVHVTDYIGFCSFDTTFNVHSLHNVEALIDLTDVATSVCANDPISLFGTVEIDGLPYLPGDEQPIPFWTTFDGQITEWAPDKALRFIAVPDADSIVVLTAKFEYPDTICTSRDTAVFTILKTPDFAFADDSIFVPTDRTAPLVMDAAPGFFDYRWSSTPDGHTDGLPMYPDVLSSVELTCPEQPYMLHIGLLAENGCMVRDSVYVGILLDFFIPNAFTPNGDGIHDYWRLFPLKDYQKRYRIEATVFTRSGMMVFQSKDYSNAPPAAFDGRKGGKDLPTGTYYYVVKIVSRDSGEEEAFTGSVTIIR